MEHIKPIGPLKMDGNLAENWRRWKLRWNLYATASGVSEKEENTQCAVFLHTIGEDALEVYETFMFAESENNKLDPIINKFEAYCAPKKNVTYERYIFNSCKQNGRPIDVFVTDLRNKAKSCEYGTLQDSLIKDRIVCGIDNNIVRERLLRNTELTLEQAISTVRAAETSKTQTENLKSMPLETAAIKTEPLLRKKPVNGARKKEQFTKSVSQTNKMKCGRCGLRHGPQTKECKAIGSTCHKCQGKNHWASVCRTKVQNIPKSSHKSCHNIEEEYEDDPSFDELFIGEIESMETNSNELFATLKVNDEDIKFKIDTGAMCNTIPEYVFDAMTKKPKLKKTNTKLTGYSGSRVPVKGKCDMLIEHNNRMTIMEFYIVKVANAKPIIGLPTSRTLQLINIHKDVSEINSKGTDLLENYKDVFTGLGLVAGEYHIELREDAKPTIHPPRKVPLSLMPRLKETLEKLEKSGVVSKVTKATDWVNSLVIVEKKNNTLRLCLDPKDLNKSIKREHYKAPSTETISSKLNGKTIFTVIDMSNCYWHKKLDEDSSYLCTFNTPFGRWKFNRMPFGVCSSADVAQRMVDDNFGDIPDVLAVHDDIIIAGKTLQEHDKALQLVLQRARERNIKFNREKVQLRVNQVKYLGNIVSADGFKPDPDKIKAITEMPKPESKQELQRLLGMVNYLSQYIPNMSEITAPLRTLLRKDSQWIWYHEHDSALTKIKQTLTASPVLRFFDVNKPTTIQCDASQSGLGACLLQDGHPVIYASRSLTSAEKNYAMIEKELLAIVFATERFHQFVYGTQIKIQSDHRPLEYIMTKPLSQTPPRIQRLLIRLQKYQLTVEYVPGKLMFIADTLSRAFLHGNVKEQQDLDEDIGIAVHSFVTQVSATPEKLEQLKLETARDSTLQALKIQIINGWPTHKHSLVNNNPNIAPYWNVRHELSEADGLIFKGNQLIIPDSMKKYILGLIHESHLGIEKCKARARATVYWPGISSDINETVSKCSTCTTYRNRNQKEPMIAHTIPDRPWQKLGSDIFEHKGKNYLVIVDYHSKFIEIALMHDKTAGTVITHMKSIFARHGIPEELISDNMPYNSREFHNFAKEWGFQLTSSSPTYPQSNGMSEKAVQTVKRMLKKARDPYIALLEYRNTPVTGMSYSPAQLLMSRTTRTKLPTAEHLLQPKIATSVKQQLQTCQKQQAHYYNRNAKPLKPLNENEGVRIQQHKQWVPAKVLNAAHTPRSYLVATENGQEYRRNRKHILKTNEPPPIINQPSDIVDDEQNLQPTTEDPSNTTTQQVDPPRRTSTRKRILPTRFKDYVMGN